MNADRREFVSNRTVLVSMTSQPQWRQTLANAGSPRSPTLAVAAEDASCTSISAAAVAVVAPT